MDREVRSSGATGPAPQVSRRGAAGGLVLRGHAALFNVETVIAGLFREVIRPGAFSEAIGRDDVRCLFNHSADYVLGRTTAGTLRLSEDRVGLRYDVDLPGSQWAKDFVLSVERGDITQSSFAFLADLDEWPPTKRDELPLRVIRRARLFDVSPVTHPAYEQTTVSAHAASAATEAWRGDLERERMRLRLAIKR
jgi:uncharacterized protein